MNYVCTAYTFIYTYLFTYLFTITLVAPIKIPMVVKPKCLWPCFSIAVFHCLLHKKSTSSSKLFTYLLHGAESLLRSQLILQLVKKFSAFLEPEGSSPYSQVPSTSLYPEPTPSSPHNPSHFLKIHLNIILPSMSGSPQWSLSLRFPHQNPVHPSPLPYKRHMPRPSHSSLFYHPHNIR